MVVVTSGILDTLAGASAGVDTLGLVSDSTASTASVCGLLRGRDVLVVAVCEESLQVAEKVAHRVASFAACVQVAVVPGGVAAHVREGGDLAGFWLLGQRVECRVFGMGVG